MKSKLFAEVEIKLSILIFVSWISLGVWLFTIEPFNYSWSRGEIGDFLNGLAAISLIFIGPTALWQYRQLKEQQAQSYEEGVFRTFEMLKPELANLSVRIVAKTIDKKEQKYEYLDDFSFEEIKDKFSSDKTCFLRIIQKEKFLLHLEDKLLNAEIDKKRELRKALKRYLDMMEFLDHYLNKSNDANEFCFALRATEVFQTYKSLKKHCTSLDNVME
jgi:predicted DNA-binding protein YlxM (UPF0122 family)